MSASADIVIDEYDRIALSQYYDNLQPLTSSIGQRALTTTGLDIYSGDWGEAEVLHLLRRCLFGVKYSEFDIYKLKGLSEAIETIVTTDPDPAPPVNDYYEELADPDVGAGQTWITAPKGENSVNNKRINSLNVWLNANMINQPATIHEKMILFWHNLIPTENWGVSVPKMSYQYFMTLRKYALGNYKSLIREITLDPAMLKYLNGNSNQVGSPDENYARELQELFTVGKGSGSGYTEKDIQEAARLLTGFRYNWNDLNAEGAVSSYFQANKHDTGNKQFSSFYGNRLIKGGSNGYDELDELVDMIFETDEVAKYFCRRLYNFFVYSDIDESVETNVIEPLAQLMRDSNYEVMPVVKKLLSSAHFFDDANRGAQIKNPMDHLFGFWRTTDTQHIDESNGYLKHKTFMAVYNNYQKATGMPIGNPPSVAGWPAYYQTPTLDRMWISTDSITIRAAYVERMINGKWWIAKIDSTAQYLATDVIRFAETLSVPSNPNELIRDCWKLLMGMALTQESLDYLKSALLSGQDKDSYWSGAWSDYKVAPTEMNRQVVESRLRAMLVAMCQLGEFQLM